MLRRFLASAIRRPIVAQGPAKSICIVGPGTRFLSGITYYTFGLARALSPEFRTSVIFLRQLLPRLLYPGKERVGADLSDLEVPRGVRTFDGIDWPVVPSFFRAAAFLRRERPAVLVFQWWSGTVVHTYLLLWAVARLLGIRTVVEFHEVQDPGELGIPVAAFYVKILAPRLFKRADGFVVHSEFDRQLLQQAYRLPAKPTVVIPHAAYDHYASNESKPIRACDDEVCNLLFFGLIRPYKGLNDLVAAFDELSPEEVQGYWLTIVGESWEDSDSARMAVANSRYRERITFVNRYVDDAEVDGYFSGADVVVVPYHRSSQSGILRIAMHYGLPVVLTDVGGLPEVVSGYGGAIVVPARNRARLVVGMRQGASLRGQSFADGHAWSDTAQAYVRFYEQIIPCA